MGRRRCANCRYFMHLHLTSHPALEVEICAVTGDMREPEESCAKFEEDTAERFLLRVRLSEISGGQAKHC
ncbi:MAG: hypothetical protein OEY99_00115 [Aigarchaeota archaeon]|nr:hypothetical protein [Aigarchaeota archaeon]